MNNFNSLLASTPIDLSGVDLSGITEVIVQLAPVALPVVISVLAVRKGISFLMGMVRGA